MSQKTDKQIRIFMDGCYDCLHSGHYNALRKAKLLGDYLVAGVHTDEEIKKFKRAPIWNNDERMYMVSCCKFVDKVVFDVPYEPTIDTLNRKDIQCDYIAHGDDNIESFRHVKEKLKIFNRTPGISTTSIINKLLLITKPKDDKNNQITSNDQNALNILDMTHFLCTSEQLSKFSNHKTPKPDDTIIYIDGDFDLFHCGHQKIFENIKKNHPNSFLYVGIYNDDIIRKIRYNNNYWPLMTMQERCYCVLASKFVDEIIIGCPFEITKDLINVLRIDIIYNGPHINIINDDNLLNKKYRIPKKLNVYKEISFNENDKLESMTTNKLIDRMINNYNLIKQQNTKRLEKEINIIKSRSE